MIDTMKESVSAVFRRGNKIFMIKRQNYLRVFPGYHAPPGGKVEESDQFNAPEGELYPSSCEGRLLNALIREVAEELEYSIADNIKNKNITGIHYIGHAITPEFNPYRFKNFYFLIDIKDNMIRGDEFVIDKNEAEYGEWKTEKEWIEEYEKGNMLIVAPALFLIKHLETYKKGQEPIEFTSDYNAQTDVPELESIYGIKQFLPLSHTFPPANRTNCFLIGDNVKERYLIDPSPIDENELNKLIRQCDHFGFSKIMITHHHKDHWEFSQNIAKKFNVSMEMSQYTFDQIGSEYFKGIKVNILKEGDIITHWLGEEVRVYEVPGHDKGQLALAPKSMRWFLVGDLIQTVGTVVIGGPEGDMGEYFRTLARVIELNPKNVIPSHGIIIGGVAKLQETLNHRKIREDQIIELLRMNKSQEEILEIVYVGLKEGLLPYAMKTIKAHIKKINQEQLV